MTTARDLITKALRKIHVLGVGSSLDANEADEALQTLNNMLSSFSAEGALVFQETRETFNLSANQASYTIGTGLNFNTIKPLVIKAAFVTQGSTDYPVTPYDEQEYSRISQKQISGSVPRIYYYDDNFPTATIFFYPVPSAADTFTWSVRKALATFDTLDTVFAMPGQYESMIVHNLAEWLAPEYEREPSGILRKLAIRTKKTVIVQNEQNQKSASILTGIPSRGAPSQYSDHNVFSGYFT